MPLVSTGINPDHFVYFNHGDPFRLLLIARKLIDPSVIAAEPWLCLTDTKSHAANTEGELTIQMNLT